ncbi:MULTISPECIES: hypothetical protein [unclassified Nocardiopsis]|uniref:hypothetical protein n=1 Tax=unclassified Nocardiopsis TaxID=2649073 RepID=UPI0033D6CABA
MNEQRAEHFRRVRTAASQMMWAQDDIYPWLGEEWPPHLRRAWSELERELERLAEEDVAALEGFDPAHHLLSRRGPQGQPITLRDAAEDWHQRITRGPKIAPVIGPSGYPSLAPGSAVILTTGWHMMFGFMFRGEFDSRLAPGRPAVTFGPQSRELAEAYRDLAAQLRAPLGDGAPGRAVAEPVAADTPTRERAVSEADYRRLCELAGAAAEAVPSREEIIADREMSVSVTVADVARRVSRILEGSPEPAWVEPTEGVEPSVDQVRDAAMVVSLEEQGRRLRDRFGRQEAPQKPDEWDALEDYQSSSWPIQRPRRLVLSPAYALVIAEVLDEFAARFTPGQSVGRMRFDAFPLCVFLRRLEARWSVL